MEDPPAWPWELAPAQPDAAGCGYLLFLMATKISSSRQGARRDSNRAPLPRQHWRGPQNPPDGGSWGGHLRFQGAASMTMGTSGQRDAGTERHQGMWERGKSPPVLAGSQQPRTARAGLATGQPVPVPGTASPYRSVTVPTCLCRGGMTSDTRATSLGCASSLLSPQAALGEARDRGNGPKIALQQHSRGRATAGGTEVTSGRARPALWWLWLGHGMGTRRA